MARFAALFRGLNVGGKGRVRMAELEAMLTGLGLARVQTLLQSGNAVFDSTLSEAELTARIREAFLERFGFDSGAQVRGAAALRALAEGIPFTAAQIAAAEAADPEAEHLYVYFLEEEPTPARVDAILRDNAEGDALAAAPRALYLLCTRSVRLSKTASRLAKAYPTATARNGNTLRRLAELTGELDARG